MWSRVILGAVVLFSLSGPPAAADQTAAERCAESLPPDAGRIYRDAAPDVTKDTTLRAVLTTHVKRMVEEGRISLFDARPAAQRAAICLQELQD